MGQSNRQRLIETVPRAHLAARLSDEFADWPLLVPETCLPGTSFYEALEPFFGARRVVPISNCEWTLVRDLVLIDAPCFGPIHTWTGAWPRTSDYVSDVELLSEMRSIYIDCFQIRRGDGPRRIFLSRSKSERLYNQKAIEEIAAAFGFVIVHPETLSFRDQIQLFHNADCIVGPSGAAWSGILFSRPGTVGLNWTFPEYSEACMFTNLALVSGVELFHFFVDSFQDLKCSDDAFRASYAVSERFFEDQLGQLIERVPSGEVQGPGGERKL